MIYGTGIDMIETERVEMKISKESGFREMVFSEQEIKYCEARTHKFQHYAARFAAKEAFLKALGSGWSSGIAFHEIEIINDAGGKPELQVHGQTAKIIAALGIGKISVSLSHLKSIAAAVVIIENKHG